MSDIITTLHPENDENTNLYPNIKQENIPNGAVDRNKLGSGVNSLLDNISELHPSGTDTSTNILAKTSNQGIFVATDNGHWYYWNGTQYVDGGAFLTSNIVSGRYASILVGRLDIDTTNLTITSTGVQYNTNDYSANIALANQSISYSINSQPYYIYFDRQYNTIVAINSVTQSTDLGNAQNNSKMYLIAILFNKNLTFTLSGNYIYIDNVKYNDAIINKNSNIELVIDINSNMDNRNYLLNAEIINGIYTTSDGTTVVTQYGGSSISDFIEVKQNLYTLSTNFYRLFKYDENHVLVNYDGTPSNLFAVTEDNVKYVRFSFSTVVSNVKMYQYPYNKNTFSNTLLPYNTDDFISIFNKIVCCGDSLTAGRYPEILSHLSGVECVNGGQSGYTTIQYWENYAQGVHWENYNCAIIFLGTNGGLTDTLDTDVEPYSDYDDYANTNTGDYCKIIEYAKSVNPNIRIFLCTIWRTDISETTNSVINKIAARYDLPVIDNNLDIFTSTNRLIHPRINEPTDVIHCGRIGYYYLAKNIIKQMGVYIYNNQDKYNLGL